MKGHLTSIDPGVHQSYVAHFADGVLVRLEVTNLPVLVQAGARLACEVPEVYAGKFERDLIDLALAAGRVCANHPAPEYVRPSAWKGQVPKKVHHPRIRFVLTEAENALIDAYPIANGLRHNLVDAVGIGLHALGRKYVGGLK